MRKLVAAAVILASHAGTMPSTRAAEPLQVGQTFLSAGLDPTKASNGWALASHGIGENLFTVDAEGSLVPGLAMSAKKLDARTWTVTLQPDRKFSDGATVTADLVTKALAHTVAANPGARATGGTLTFAVVDPQTFRVTTEKPVATVEALLAEWPLVVYHLLDDGSATFSGPYKVASFAPDQSLTLDPNPYYPGALTRSPVMLRKFGDAETLALAFEAGQLDLAFGLLSPALPRLRSNPNLTVKSFPVAYQYMAWFNTKRPTLSDTAVRQALDLGFDRQQIALAINGGVPATGAFAAYFPFAEKTPRPFDLPGAKSLLDKAGWTLSANGLRTKDGKPLSLNVLAYPQRPDLVAMLPVIKAQFKALGVDAQTRTVENVGQVAGAGDFDILLWAQNTAPSGDPMFFLNGMLRSESSLNYSRYSNPELDAVLDRLGSESDPKIRLQLTSQAQKIVFSTAPVSFLLTPDWHVGLSKRLAAYEPWGSDYHILRPAMGEAP